MCDRAGGAAMRRRERRFRSWAKHERMTAAMARAEHLHHSRQKVEGGEHKGPRAQKTVRATGARPGVLKDPEPQGGSSPGRLRGCPGAFFGGGVAGWRRRCGRLHHQEPPQVRSPQEAEGGGRGRRGVGRSSRRLPLGSPQAVDVPVIINDEVQHFMLFQFSSECRTFQLRRGDRYPQCKLCSIPSWYWCSSWMAVTRLLLCDDRCRR